ncbi:hypothetical protein OV208_40475 [Corallococcus sp. bb12-1]|uniref:hypothetical protein n=1 Tax=Corallococcus sp. bb12-1 TaxID=2996784 RepID=UPI002271F80C|nr:hypothetical protein [Corallococcus sp. bb12-1]MCY1047644.1 hypothetical protein [Corallococcus sp. bb12-1]
MPNAGVEPTGAVEGEATGPGTAPNARVAPCCCAPIADDGTGGIPTEGAATPGPPAPPDAGPTTPKARVWPMAWGGGTPDVVVLTGGRGAPATGAMVGGGGMTPDELSGPEGGVGCGTNEPVDVVCPANSCVDLRPAVSPPKTWVEDWAPVRSTPPPAGGGFGAGGTAPCGEAMKT